jgi:hypothetical protein
MMTLRTVTARKGERRVRSGYQWVVVCAAVLLAGCSSDHEGSFGADVPDQVQDAAKPAAEVTPLPITATGLLKGNFTPEFGAGKPGKVSVVAQGPLSADGDRLPVAVRNNTGDVISQIEVAATARGAGAKSEPAGTSQGTFPMVLDPGGVALAYIDFPEKQAKTATYTFTVTSAEPSSKPSDRASLRVVDANLVGDTVTGAMQNVTQRVLKGNFDVEVFCFSGAGKLTAVTGATAFGSPGASAAPGDQRTYNVTLYGVPCAKFLVGSNGFIA